MTPFRNCKVKKLYRGFASIRDYLVERVLEQKRKGIVIQYGEHRMTIPLSKLEEKFQIHNIRFESKYDGKRYGLYDFKFIPDVLLISTRKDNG